MTRMTLGKSKKRERDRERARERERGDLVILLKGTLTGQ